MADLKLVSTRLRTRMAGWQNKQRIQRMARQVAEQAQPQPDRPPIVAFNASTRLTGLSLNAAFQLLTTWGLRLAGFPVVQFVCQSGLSRCVLGTDRDDFSNPPPCQPCIAQSQRLFSGAQAAWFSYQPDAALGEALEGLSIDQLSQFKYALLNNRTGETVKIPLGQLVMPSIRWALRRHHLDDDPAHRFLLSEYIRSAFHTAREFNAVLEREKPAAVLVFNAAMYPEATARWVAHQHGLPVIAHEVGFQRLSAFFTLGQPTAYPMAIPSDFELDSVQNEQLDAYLEKRFQGQFTMAGIQFWPEMRGLDAAFLQHASQFRQIVPVFTNVVYDTSQMHANVIFPHMFAWLDRVLEMIRSHPETLFVIRAHPDEMRPNSAKLSRESVRDWVHDNQVDQLPNAIFIDSQEYISSYELIQRSKFVMVYNSSIGLEAALMGSSVLCGGKARYTQYPIVYSPDSPEEYRKQAETFLAAGSGERKPAPIGAPVEFQKNARRFLYFQLYRASLPFDNFLEVGPRQGFVSLKAFSWQELLPENSITMQILIDGILHGKPFLLGADES
jgi:Capsule polysaccharide biosynthesis protein